MFPNFFWFSNKAEIQKKKITDIYFTRLSRFSQVCKNWVQTKNTLSFNFLSNWMTTWPRRLFSFKKVRTSPTCLGLRAFQSCQGVWQYWSVFRVFTETPIYSHLIPLSSHQAQKNIFQVNHLLHSTLYV